MDNSTPNHNQDDPNDLRFRNHFKNDSGVENCSFLRNEALCSVKPPRILLNDVPLDITINRSLFNESAHAFDENIVNATASSGLGSMVNDNNSLPALNATDQLISSSEDSIEESAMDKSILNRVLCSAKPPKLLLSDVPFDTPINQPELGLSSIASGLDHMYAETSKNSSKYSIEDGVIVIESDDEIDSIDTKLNQSLENYTPTISQSRLKALHDISMQVVNAEKKMSSCNDMPEINQPQSTEVNYDVEVIDLSKDDDLFNTTLERVDSIFGDYKPKISEARLKALHDISMQVVNVEKRKSPKRTMSLFSDRPDSIAEKRLQRTPKRTISVEQFI